MEIDSVGCGLMGEHSHSMQKGKVWLHANKIQGFIYNQGRIVLKTHGKCNI